MCESLGNVVPSELFNILLALLLRFLSARDRWQLSMSGFSEDELKHLGLFSSPNEEKSGG